MARWLVGVLMAWCLLAAPALGAGGDSQKDSARALANAGFELYSAGNYSKALERFQSAERLYHAPPHVLFMARCQAKLGRLIEARDRYLSLLDDELPASAPPEFREAKKTATAELTTLLGRIPTVKIELSGGPAAGAEVSIDGKPAGDISQPVAVSTGIHRIAARAGGFTEVSQTVDLAEGARQTVPLSLVPASSAPPIEGGGEPAAGGGGGLVGPLVVLGAGAAGVVVGAITGAIALGKSSDLNDLCPVRASCPAQHQSLEDDARTLGTVSTIGFIAGGVGVAAGTTWLIVELMGGGEPSGGEQARLRPYAEGPVGGLRVRF